MDQRTPGAAEPAVPAGMLGLAALLAAGTANAETADDRFLGTLQQQCIGFGNTQSAITVAHHVCDALGQGTEPQRHQQQHRSVNARIDRQTALAVVVDAAPVLLPAVRAPDGQRRHRDWP